MEYRAMIREFLPALSDSDVQRELARFMSMRRRSSLSAGSAGIRSWLVMHPAYLDRARSLAAAAWARLVPDAETRPTDAEIRAWVSAPSTEHPLTDLAASSFVARHPAARHCYAMALEGMGLRSDADAILRDLSGTTALRDILDRLRDAAAASRTPETAVGVPEPEPADVWDAIGRWRPPVEPADVLGILACASSASALVRTYMLSRGRPSRARTFTRDFRARHGRDPSAEEFAAHEAVGDLDAAADRMRADIDRVVGTWCGPQVDVSAAERAAIAARVIASGETAGDRATMLSRVAEIPRLADLAVARVASSLSDVFGADAPDAVVRLQARRHDARSLAEARSAACEEYVDLRARVRAAFADVGVDASEDVVSMTVEQYVRAVCRVNDHPGVDCPRVAATLWNWLLSRSAPDVSGSEADAVRYFSRGLVHTKARMTPCAGGTVA